MQIRGGHVKKRGKDKRKRKGEEKKIERKKGREAKLRLKKMYK